MALRTSLGKLLKNSNIFITYITNYNIPIKSAYKSQNFTYTLKLKNILAFSDFEINFSYPMKLRKSTIDNEFLSSITSFTSAPMQIVTACGAILFVMSLVLGANTLYNYIAGNAREGFTTVIMLLLLTSSIIMFSLGIIGYYLSKIYEEIKRRPRYIVMDVLNKKTEKGKNKDD